MSNNSVPYEIIAAPFTAWLAPVGTAFPDIDDSPGVAWTKVGTSGDRNVSEDGVTVSHAQSIEFVRALGSPGPRKAFRTEEDCRIAFTLMDLTLEQYALALNHNTISTVAPGAVGGYKKIGLSRGLAVVQKTLLLRGPSPYGDEWTLQFKVPIAVQVAEQEVTFTKSEPGGLALEWVALEDPDAASEDERFGVIEAQNADATS